MKQNLKNIAVAVGLATLALTASAQALNTAYISDSYIYRHRLNPAIANQDNYLSYPLLGNVGIKEGMNFGVKNFVKPGPNGKLVTFMHESVSTSSFLGDLADDNKLTQNFDMTLLSWGGNTWGGYSTFEIGVHERLGLSLPKDMFAFMKEFDANKTYSFTNMQVNASAYASVALGHSRKIGDTGLRVGGKVKVLLGVAYADASFTDCTARFGNDEWSMRLKGELNVAGGKGNFTTDEDGKVDGYEDFTPGINGKGLAVDLGVEYDMQKIVPGLKLSASITDLGKIKWNDCGNAYNDGKEFSFKGFNNISLHDEDNHTYAGSGKYSGSLSDQWSDVREDLEDMYNLRVGKKQTITENLAANLHLAADYKLPFYQKLSVGVLYNQVFGDLYKYTEGRLICNYHPGKIFDMNVSAAASTYGFSAGALLNLHCTGFNLFVGADNIYLGSVNKDMIPLEKGINNIQFGINFPFGSLKKQQ